MASRRDLRIGEGLTLPIEFMTVPTVVYGAPGAGKSTFGRVVAEEVHRHRQRFCVVDIDGSWYGLKSSLDGTSEGIPVVSFGGDHADLPLEQGAGAEIADILIDIDQSAIIDLNHLSKGKQISFLVAFFERLYEKNRDPLLLLLDEAQRYIPQKPMSPDAARCLGAAEDIVKLGRKRGLGSILFTQRGSGLNKEASELCSVLVAFRSPGVLDQKRISEWLEANTTVEQSKEVMPRLAKLPTGSAIVASGLPELDRIGVVVVRRPWTFDSSATPKIGERRIEPKQLAKLDIEALSVRMAAAIERSKADDPKELRREISDLKVKLAKQEKVIREAADARADVVEIEVVPIITEEMQAKIEELTELLQAITDQVGPDEYAARPVERPPAPRPPQKSNEPSQAIVHEWKPDALSRGQPGDPLGKAERTIVAVLQQHADGLSRTKLAFLTGYSPRTSTLSVALGRLRRDELVLPGSDPIDLTEKGHRYDVGAIDPLPPPGPDRAEYWMMRLGKAEREILRVMLEAHPRELGRAEIAEQTGYSPQTSTLSVAFGKLRGLKLIENFRVSEDLVGA